MVCTGWAACPDTEATKSFDSTQLETGIRFSVQAPSCEADMVAFSQVPQLPGLPLPTLVGPL